jgi:carbon monoxide dehydrogenase subunit G
VKLEQTFEVDAPLERVWEALIDVERVAPCLPGATVSEAGEGGTYEGTFSAKVGPASVSFKGTLKMEQVDEASHSAVMQANGSNRRGQGGAKATIRSTVSPGDGGGTKVDIDTDYTITGPLARLGRGGMIEDVGNRLLREFAACLEQRLAHGGRRGGAGADRADASPGPAAAGEADRWPQAAARGAARPTEAPVQALTSPIP